MNNIKRLREKAGLTQKEVAEKVFVTQQAVAKWERGDCFPQADKLQDIAEALSTEKAQITILDIIANDDEFAKMESRNLKDYKYAKTAMRIYRKNNHNFNFAKKQFPQGYFLLVDLTRDYMLEYQRIRALPDSYYKKHAINTIRRLIRDSEPFYVPISEQDDIMLIKFKNGHFQGRTETWFYRECSYVSDYEMKVKNATLIAAWMNKIGKGEYLSEGLRGFVSPNLHWLYRRFDPERVMDYWEHGMEDKEIETFLMHFVDPEWHNQ